MVSLITGRPAEPGERGQSELPGREEGEARPEAEHSAQDGEQRHQGPHVVLLSLTLLW